MHLQKPDLKANCMTFKPTLLALLAAAASATTLPAAAQDAVTQLQARAN